MLTAWTLTGVENNTIRGFASPPLTFVFSMLRLSLPLTSSKPLLNTSIVYSALRRVPPAPKPRFFSNGLVQLSQKKFANAQIPRTTFRAPGWRTFTTDTKPMIMQSQPFSWQRFAVTAAGVAGAVVVLDGIFNRDTRDPLTVAERQLLNDSFTYTGAGLAFTALAARSLFKSGVAFRIMAANPWVVLGVGLVGSIGSMMGTMYTAPENKVQKHLFWLAFNACQAATLSPLFFFSPAILSRAALYTVGVVGSISYIGATATNDKYLNLGGPLLAGVTVVALSSLAPMVLPMGLRALAVTEAVSLYGGLAVFGGFVLYDTQKILKHARLAEKGVMVADPINESIGLELDMINIFIRIVQILSMQSNRKK